MKKLLTAVTMLSLSFLCTQPAHALDLCPWNNHAAPFNFLFGNEFDTHQQSRQLQDGSLFGFLYVTFTGAFTTEGYRVATHTDCNANAAACTVGWTIDGKPRWASFLYQPPSDHPVFLVRRPYIPEPGAYAHFHWLGADPKQGEKKNGFLLQLTAVDTFCFVHSMPGEDRKSCRDLGGVVVKPGIDIATHLNIVASPPQ